MRKSPVLIAILLVFLSALSQDSPPHPAPVTHNTLQLLTDTHGVDVSPYVSTLRDTITRHWHMPREARAPKLLAGTFVINFIIERGGKLTDVKVKQADGNVNLGRAAYAAITTSKPFPPLPENFQGDQLKFQAEFDYNPKEQ